MTQDSESVAVPRDQQRQLDAEQLMDAAGTLSRCGYGEDAEEVRAIALRLIAPSTSVREEVEYEVWQDDAFGDGEAMVAGSTNLADAQHYAAVYSQDGPAWVVEVTRRHFRAEDAAALVPSTDEGKRHG